MRWRRVLLRTAVGLAVTLAVVFGALQTGVGQRMLFNTIASLASAPGRVVRLEGPSGFFPTDMTLARVEVSDGKGVWLDAAGVRVTWAVLPLLDGRLEIETLRAASVAVNRLPETPPGPPPVATVSTGRSNRLPFRLSVASLFIDDLKLGAALADIDSRWKVGGSARIDGFDAANTIALDVTRTDGRSGRLTVRADYDGARAVFRAEGSFQEGAGGVLAALLRRPDLPGTAGTFKAEGSRDGGDARITVEAGEALRIAGSGRMRPDGTGRHVTLSVDIHGGQLPHPLWQAALVRPARVEADMLLGPAGTVDLRMLRISAAPLEATASGRYSPDGRRVELRVAATGGDMSIVSALVPGVALRDARLEIQAGGTMSALDATISLRASAVSAPTAKVDAVDLTFTTQGADATGNGPLRGRLKGALGTITVATSAGPLAMRDMRLDAAVERTPAGAVSITSLDVASSLMTASGSGTLAVDGGLAATVRLDLPDLSPLAPVVNWQVAGAARLDMRIAGTMAQPAVTLDATVRDAVVATVPPALLRPTVRLAARGSVDRQGRWRLDQASIASEAMTVDATGTGRGATGTADLSIALPRLSVLDPRYDGHLRSEIRVEATDTGRTIRLKAQLAEAKVDGATLERLDIDAGIVVRADDLEATLELSGSSGGQPLKAKGRLAAKSGERLSIPTFEASLGNATLSIRDLVVDRTSASGSARLVIEDLKEVGALAGQPAGGRLELTVVPDAGAEGGRLKLTLRGSELALGAFGAGTVSGDATLVDPLGRASFDAVIAASGLRGVPEISGLTVKASGDRTAVTATADISGGALRANGAVRARFTAGETILDIGSLKGTRDGRPFALAQATQIRHAGLRTVIEPLRLTFAGSQVRVAGVLDVDNSDLAVDVAPLALAEVAALAGSAVRPTGTVQAQVRLRGARDNPQIDVTYAIRDARMRSIATASLPAVTLTGKATVRNRSLTADGRLMAGGSTLVVAATAQVPAGGGLPDGRITLTGPIQLAMFASLLGPDIQQVGGRALLDVSIARSGGRASGSGTVRLENVNLAMPSEGLTLSRGTGQIRLSDDRIIVDRLVFPSVGKGDLSLTGEVRLDDKLSLPVDLRVEARRARLLNRRDLLAELTASLRVTGSVAEGLRVEGTVRVDRADIGVVLGGASKAVPTIAVREIGAGAPKAVKTSAPAHPIALDVKVSAPRGVFVRGKGLDAELQGEFTVSGTTASPSLTGGLGMRRGTYTVLGRPLQFARGNVTFVNADRIVPVLDLAATTRGGDVTVEVIVTGPASEPKIALSSTPQLPQDEIMARFLFGQRAGALGPSQLVQVAEALAEFTGSGSSGSTIDTVRRALGLDRLGIGAGDQSGTSGGSSGLAAAGVEGGRYIARGIYVGGRQGLQGDTRGVVQIEVIPHVKIEAEYGTRSTGRAGIAIEYDY